MTSQEVELVKGVGWHVQKGKGEKCPLVKNQPVSANWW